ncbi:MAG: peptidoglycan DD-metalloendopeptidase family protein [Myxococcota bacterium]
MRAEETPERAEGHRPLPSVKIPLLREERRATRVRRAAVAGALVLTAAGGVGAAVLFGTSGNREKESGNARAAEAPDTDAPPTEGPEGGEAEAEAMPSGGDPDASVPDDSPQTPGAVERKVVTFGSSPTFRHALEAAGVDREAGKELEGVLDGVLDFRRCRPSHRMVFEHDAEGRIVLFEYHAGPRGYVQATRGAQGELRAEQVDVPVDIVRRAKGGRVETSIGDALERVGLGRSLVGAFVSTFAGRANFSKDARRGDVFRIVVDEKYIEDEFLRYGTVHAMEYLGQRTDTLRAYWYEPRGDESEGNHYDEGGRALQGGWLRTPCRYDRISSPFDPRRMHPTLRRIVPHNGVDYAASGGTPVRAAAAGKVTFAARKGANGNLVSIRHDNGYETLYAHLSRFAKGIESGVSVDQRQVIGYVGSTGRSTGPHLHFALKRHGRFLDPQEELNGPGRRLPAAERKRFQRHKKKLDAELGRIRIGSKAIARKYAEAESAEEPRD